MSGQATTPRPLWTPSGDAIERSHLRAYERWLAETRGLSFESYADLWAWSVADVGGFWETIWQYFDVQSSAYETPLADDSMPGARWFPGAELSYVEHIFRGKDPAAPHRDTAGQPCARCPAHRS